MTTRIARTAYSNRLSQPPIASQFAPSCDAGEDEERGPWQ